MPEPIRLIRLGRASYVQTQAVYHALAEMMTPASSDAIILCSPASPYLCLGYHQSFDAILDRAECSRRGLPVLRRQVGGGTTYLDSNQLFYQCVFQRAHVPAVFTGIFARLLEAPVATLQRLGLNASRCETNEIEVDGKRIAGTGGGQIGEACVVVGNLLFDFDYETLPRVWRVPSEGFRTLARVGLRTSITTLREQIGPIEMVSVEQILVEEFARTLGRPLEKDALTPAESAIANDVGARLQSEEFLNLHRGSPIRPLKISARVSIYAQEFQLDDVNVRLSLRVREGVIEDARIESVPPREWHAIELELPGTRYDACESRIRELATNPI